MHAIEALREIRNLIKIIEQTDDIRLVRKLLLEMKALVQKGLALAD